VEFIVYMGIRFVHLIIVSHILRIHTYAYRSSTVNIICSFLSLFFITSQLVFAQACVIHVLSASSVISSGGHWYCL